MEVGDSQYNFLELTIIIRNGFMIFDWHQKPTFSGRILISLNTPLHKKEELL